MKQLFGIVFTLTLSVFLTTVCFARLETQTVEISFKVGDSSLIINGEEVTVQTPYVVGEGVTLVPVRVITEAFGAEVDWYDPDKKVTLSTDEKIINLWIGKDFAEVDGKNTALLSAPELTNDITMVPLRFISENFGADVSYDEVTEAIYVTMKKLPKVRDGMYFYETDDGFFSSAMPNLLTPKLDKAENGIYKFVSVENTRYSINTIIYSCKALSDIEKSALTDRTKQTEKVKDDNLSVTEVNCIQINGLNVYYYYLTETENTPNPQHLVTKAFFNHGENTYLYLTFLANSEYDVDNEENISNIKLDGYEITVPSAFLKNDIYKSTSTPQSDSVQSLQFKVFKASEDANIKEYLRYNQAVHPSGYLSYAENEIYSAEYLFMGEKLTAYECSVLGKDEGYKNLIFKYSDYIICADFITTLSCDDINYILENIYFDFKNIKAPVFENVNTYKDMQKNSTLVTALDISFNAPNSFKTFYSSDKQFIIVKDTESDLTLFCVIEAKTINNDDKEDGIVISIPLGAVMGKVRKETANYVMQNTFDNLYSLSWTPLIYPTRVRNSAEICKTGTDEYKIEKKCFGTTLYMNCYHERFDKKYSETKQKLHCFTFMYSAEYHNFETMMKIQSITRSVKTK